MLRLSHVACRQGQGVRRVRRDAERRGTGDAHAPCISRQGARHCGANRRRAGNRGSCHNRARARCQQRRGWGGRDCGRWCGLGRFGGDTAAATAVVRRGHAAPSPWNRLAWPANQELKVQRRSFRCQGASDNQGVLAHDAWPWCRRRRNTRCGGHAPASPHTCSLWRAQQKGEPGPQPPDAEPVQGMPQRAPSRVRARQRQRRWRRRARRPTACRCFYDRGCYHRTRQAQAAVTRTSRRHDRRGCWGHGCGGASHGSGVVARHLAACGCLRCRGERGYQCRRC